MVYGYKRHNDGKFLKRIRISSSAVISYPENLEIGDNVWIWHHSIIDASNGVKIGEGCQIGAWVGIFSHSSHKAIRLYGKSYIEINQSERIGYDIGKVEIGEYTFIGAGSIIMQGVKIGKGCVIAGHSVVKTDVPDYSISSGNPARVVGEVKKLDEKYLIQNNYLHQFYFDSGLLNEILKNNNDRVK